MGRGDGLGEEVAHGQPSATEHHVPHLLPLVGQDDDVSQGVLQPDGMDPRVEKEGRGLERVQLATLLCCPVKELLSSWMRPVMSCLPIGVKTITSVRELSNIHLRPAEAGRQAMRSVMPSPLMISVYSAEMPASVTISSNSESSAK